jgi:hypothetical protein
MRSSRGREKSGMGGGVNLVGQPSIPAMQIAQEPSWPVLRPLARPLDQQRDVEKQHCERRGC